MSTLRSHPLLLGVAPTEEAAAVANRRACGGLARATAVEVTLTSRGARRHRHALHAF
jgi:hypothetical protein